MDLREEILVIANELLDDEAHFIVDVKVSTTKGPRKISVLLDGEQGINIDDCVKLSRALGEVIEERDLVDAAYTLEVSSPGVDHPLTTPRQYKKNIGRVVKVTMTDGKTYKGELKEFNDTSLLIKETKGKGKKKEIKEVEIPLSDIKKTIVQISFK